MKYLYVAKALLNAGLAIFCGYQLWKVPVGDPMAVLWVAAGYVFITAVDAAMTVVNEMRS